ncbi:L,D-transpeptidase family protein [Sulfuricurvum sp.]|uniref:L,D-transpeptidase family protein n=1 Tax=Sulfuricurvum sp. TaxID=2025608 RepID=UPI002616D934|nr:L,D-transpeptidase family protein [Sulfuricurvum sp.]MDD2780584.1 L,D-transpeptidase family protein [Sulfuricurvum sp.]
MLKITLPLLLSSVLSTLFAFEQFVVVLSPELNATSASLQRYEKQRQWVKIGDKVPVTLGRSGLGYVAFKQPLKNEGDGRSPAGVFPITSTFGYDQNTTFKLPHWHADENLYCVDDVNDSRYNKILRIYDKSSLPSSYEVMRRPDGVYRYGAVIGYNPSAQRGRGSCIFIHLNQSDKRPTSGCTAMDEIPLRTLLEWLDGAKKPQILQIVKSECGKYQKEFEGIECE